MSISRAKGLMKLELYRRIFEKYSNIKFHENPCSGIQVVPFGPWDRHTDMNKLIVVFHNFAKVPKNESKLDMEMTAYTI